MGVLKSFTIQGFKTFPDRTVLTIEDGVTAVVGPNGSGKSNIGEAMRWVLGEQNARVMRCERKMEEVIFHGTETRSALGFAEVSLLLDNSDERFGPIESLGTELHITRRLNRAGESDYYINRRDVRLKDVQSLLLDTGLGAGGYSIIAQGMIHRIMSEKPIDRRRVFEEAAGIAKFRQSKDESSRKLALAEQNLCRVADKLDELEPQMQRLSKQSETAKRYLLLRDELRGHEINLWMDKLDRLRAGKTKLGDHLRQTKEDYEKGKAEQEALDAQNEAIEQTLAELWRRAEQAQQEITKLTEEKAAAENDRHVAENDLGHVRQSREALFRSAEEAQRQAALLTEQIRERREALRQCNAELEQLATAGADVATKIQALMNQTSEAGQKAQALQTERARQTEALQQARLRSASGEAGEREREERRLALEAKQTENNALLEKSRELCQKAEAFLEEARTRGAELDNIIGGYSLREKRREAKSKESAELWESLRRRRQDAVARHALLHDLDRQYDNNHAVQMVMNAGLQGVHGTVSELIRAKNETAVAIEIALGGAMHNIVVDNEQVAEAAIALLKERKGGRATFIPLSTVRGEEMAEITGADAYVGIASRLVDCDPRYRGVVRSLLGRVAVCRDLKSAIALGRRERNRFRIVTLDGQVLHSGGTMTGGSVSRRIGVLSRRNELDALERDIKGLESKEEDASKAAAEAARVYKAAVYEREVAENDRRTAREDEVERAAAVQTAKERLDALVREQEQIGQELSALSRKRDEQERDSLAAKAEREVCEARIAVLDQQLEVYAGDQNELSDAKEALGEKGAALRAKEAAQTANRDALTERLTELEARLADTEGGEEARLVSQTAYEERIQALEGVIHAAAARGNTAAEQLTAAREALEHISADRLNAEGERSRLNLRIKERYQQNLELDRLVAKTENQLLTNQTEEESIVNELWEKYELSVSEAVKLRTDDGGHRTAKRIGELEREIRALGSVNVDAIAEHEAVAERYTHLRDQRDDANAAKADLEHIIEDITEEMRELFASRFALIRTRFTETFLEIFGGGEATLELDEEVDILESGVEIKAQPPGKKLRSISLLSGGEQSLVAIALYFAMFKVRPAPFCVLDEIDHDLDDVNVGRFARYLTQLSSGTQYLVVTHRRGTMEQAATLYGVTTKEPGVSRVIRLSLSEAESELGIQLA